VSPISRTTVSALTARYDFFLIDQFGVLRDDESAYEGAADALAILKGEGKRVIILSNSGRSGEFNADRFVSLGFDRRLFDDFVTSGDVAFHLLSTAPSMRDKKRAFTISSGGDRNLADRLGFENVAQADQADLVIISGSEAERVSLEAYRRMLEPAAARKTPCVCTNPDIHKLAAERTVSGAGAIARAYEEMGGSVRWIGKPHREIYDHALAIWANPEPSKVICIGDSIEHDIGGAATAGLDSVLVRTGILADETERGLDALMEKTGTRPTFLMKRFSP
jgi:HAD superfamily hydrolase (TIGR01459 family)